MDNSHIMIIVLAISIFSIAGLSCGLIIHDNCPAHIKDIEDVKNYYEMPIDKKGNTKSYSKKESKERCFRTFETWRYDGLSWRRYRTLERAF